VKRVAPALAWLAFFLTLIAAIGWGAHAPSSWDVDNIAPGSVLRALAAHFGPGWYSSYGPIPYLLVAVVYLPILLVFRLTGELGVPFANYPWGFHHPEVSIGFLIVAARLVSVGLACAIAALAVRGRWSGTARDAWLPPLLLAGSPAFVYYARTTNVDVFYLFFLALAFFCADRATSRRARVGAGIAAALAICSKEQAAPYALVAGLAAAWAGFRAGDSAATRARAFVEVAVAAVFTYVLAWALPFHLAGWRAHHRFLFEQARYPREFPATPRGLLDLTRRALSLLPVTIGWPILVGAALAAWRPREWRGVGARFLAQTLYALGFLAVIGYVYPRFLLPALLLLLPLAIRGWSAVFDRGRRTAAVAAAVLAVATLLGGPVLDAGQLRDTRVRAWEWLEAARTSASATAGPGARPTVDVIGNPRFQTRVPAGYATRWSSVEDLARERRNPAADVVVLSSFDAFELKSDSLLHATWWRPLHDPAGPYRLAADIPPPRWLISGLPVSPVIWIWVRRAGPLGP